MQQKKIEWKIKNINKKNKKAATIDLIQSKTKICNLLLKRKQTNYFV